MKGAFFMVTPFLHKIHAILQMMWAVFCILEIVLRVPLYFPKEPCEPIVLETMCPSMIDWGGDP
jgi:hypothetical protein